MVVDRGRRRLGRCTGRCDFLVCPPLGGAARSERLTSAFDPLQTLAVCSIGNRMSDYRHPRWLPDTYAARFAGKLLRPFAELGLFAAVLTIVGAPWWLLAIVGLVSLPYLRLRFRDIRDAWTLGE